MRYLTFIFILTLALPEISLAQSFEKAATSQQNSEPEQLIERKALILEIAKSQAEIESREDLHNHLSKKDSPLYKLSPESREIFLSSIVFTKNGIGGIYSKPLVDELNDEEIYAIARLFGIQFELSLINPNVMTESDSEILRLLRCETSNCFGNSQNRVCVALEAGGTECRDLRWHECFSGC